MASESIHVSQQTASADRHRVLRVLWEEERQKNLYIYMKIRAKWHTFATAFYYRQRLTNLDSFLILFPSASLYLLLLLCYQTNSNVFYSLCGRICILNMVWREICCDAIYARRAVRPFNKKQKSHTQPSGHHPLMVLLFLTFFHIFFSSALQLINVFNLTRSPRCLHTLKKRQMLGSDGGRASVLYHISSFSFGWLVCGDCTCVTH